MAVARAEGNNGLGVASAIHILSSSIWCLAQDLLGRKTCGVLSTECTTAPAHIICKLTLSMVSFMVINLYCSVKGMKTSNK